MKNKAIFPESVVGQVVAADIRTAAVFSKYHIDFCCKGDRTIREACRLKHIDEDSVLQDLKEAVVSSNDSSINFENMAPDLLVDYIVKVHHAYVERAVLEIRPYLDKVTKVHGERHPELYTIREEFLKAAGALAMHMKKEEIILFPFIRKLAGGITTGEEGPFTHIEEPIAMMEMEHEKEGARFEQIRQLTNNYQPPEDACQTYRLVYGLLEAFERDLHRHIHLENNILFPKALVLSSETSAIIHP